MAGRALGAAEGEWPSRWPPPFARSTGTCMPTTPWRSARPALARFFGPLEPPALDAVFATLGELECRLHATVDTSRGFDPVITVPPRMAATPAEAVDAALALVRQLQAAAPTWPLDAATWHQALGSGLDG